MKKLLAPVKKNINFLLFLGLILVIGLISYDASFGLNDYRLAQYLPDYSMGFCSRFLVGSFLMLFNHPFTPEWLTDFSAGVYIFTAFLTALALNRLIKSSPEYKKELPVTTILLLACPFGFSYFAWWLGMLDVFWFIFTLLALICFENKYLCWLLPVFSFLCIATHYMACLVFFPVLAAVLLFEIGANPGKKSLVVLFMVTTFISVAAGVWFVFFATNYVKMDEAEALDYLNSKLFTNQEQTLFYLYGTTRGESVSGVSGILDASAEYLGEDRFNFASWFKLLINVIPSAGFFTAVYVVSLRSTENKILKLASVLCIAFNILPWLIISVSPDTTRWFALYIIAQSMIVLYLVYRKNPAVSYGFGKVTHWLKTNPVALCILVYAGIISAS